MGEYIYWIGALSTCSFFLIASFQLEKIRHRYEVELEKATAIISGYSKHFDNVYYGNKSMRHSNEMYKALKMISTLDGDRFASMEAKEVLEKIGAE